MKMKRSLSRFPASLMAPAAIALVSVLGAAGDAPGREGDSLARQIERSTLGTPETARAFGDISAVPTMFMFDTEGRTAEARIASLLHG